MAPIVYACDLFVNFGNLRLRIGEAMTVNIYTQINNVMFFLAEARVTGEAVAQHCCNGDVTFLWEIFVTFFLFLLAMYRTDKWTYFDAKS